MGFFPLSYALGAVISSVLHLPNHLSTLAILLRPLGKTTSKALQNLRGMTFVTHKTTGSAVSQMETSQPYKTFLVLSMLALGQFLLDTSHI